MCRRRYGGCRDFPQGPVESSRRGSFGSGSYVLLSRPNLRYTDRPVALRDDDAEDDEGAGVGDQEAKDQKKESMEVDNETQKKPREVQPTGRVVGVVKRNWRA